VTKGNAYTEREKGKVGDRERRKGKKEEEFEEEGGGGGRGEEEERREKKHSKNILSLLNFFNERSDWMCMLK